MVNIYDAYENDLRLRGADPRSIQTYSRVTRLWQAWLAENGLTSAEARKADVQAWLLSTGWAPSTMRNIGLAYVSAAYEPDQAVPVASRRLDEIPTPAARA
jgi:hypothetical protein